MKKSLTVLLIVFCSGILSGQSFDWNLRGGLNLMNSKSPEKDMALYYHAGLQAGVRITNFGFYGEVLYSVLEDQYGGEPLGYLAPSLLLKGYVLKFLFFEFGGTMLSKVGDSERTEDILNPDGKIFMSGGLGVHFSKLEISMRSTAKQSYGVVQLTAALKF